MSIIPASILSAVLEGLVGSGNTWRFFLVTGPVEEYCKYSAAKRAMNKEKEFDEHSDGIVFAAAAALGFAFVENIFYFATTSPVSWLVRSVMAVPAHVLFAVFWGEALGRLKFVPGTSKSVVWNGLIMASMLHGLYDTLLMNNKYMSYAVFYALMLGLFIFKWRQYGQLMKRALFFQNHELVSIVPAAETVKPEPAMESGESVPAVEPVAADVHEKVAHAQSADAPAPDAVSHEQPEKTKFQWGYFIKTICFVVPSLLPIGIACKQVHGAGDINFILAMGLIMLIGVIMGVWSPGCTIREVALGMAFIGSLAGAISWKQAFASALTIGLLGAVGAWIGETLQNRTRRCPTTAHSHRKDSQPEQS